MVTGGYAPTVYRLAGLMLHFYRGDGRYVDVSARFFATQLGVDRGTVVRALDVLENEGWLIPAGRSRARAPRFRLGKPESQK
jgi:CRP-like cAMP-binding protein